MCIKWEKVVKLSANVLKGSAGRPPLALCASLKYPSLTTQQHDALVCAAPVGHPRAFGSFHAKKKKISPCIASGKLFEVKSLQIHLIMELLLNSAYSEWIMLHQISVSNHLPTGFVDILGKVGEMYFAFIYQTLAAASTDNCSVISCRTEIRGWSVSRDSQGHHRK